MRSLYIRKGEENCSVAFIHMKASKDHGKGAQKSHNSNLDKRIHLHIS